MNWEEFLREHWNDEQTWIKSTIIQTHRLSWSFLRQFKDEINWNDILSDCNKQYSEEEKQEMIKEFNIECRSDLSNMISIYWRKRKYD